MTWKTLTTCFLLLIITSNVKAQIELTESNLPMIFINADEEITDEGRVNAIMKVYFNEDGTINKLTDDSLNYNGIVGIKLRGQTSLALFDKKSYSVETRDSNGDDDNVNLIGFPKESDWVLHGPYSDKTLIRNALMYTLADDIMPYAPRVQLVEVVVNDDYKGVYLFTEKIKRDDSRVDIARLKSDDIEGDELTGGYILAFDKAEDDEIGWTSPYSISADQPTRFIHIYPEKEDLAPEQANYIENWINEFEDVMNSDDFADPINGYRKYIDTETFIELILLNELSRNVDAYRLSTFMYKDKDSNDEKLHMGPVWDFNIALGNANYCEGSNKETWAYDFNEFCPDDFWQNHFWWKKLLSDPEFKEELKVKWEKLRNGKFSDEKIMQYLTDFKSQLDNGPQQRNFERWDVLGEWTWPNNYIGEDYEEEFTYLEEWLFDRMYWMDSEIDIQLDTNNPSAESLIVSPNPVGGVLTLKGLKSEMSTSYQISDMTGKLVLSGLFDSSKEINLPEMSPGVYILSLEQNGVKTSMRFYKR